MKKLKKTSDEELLNLYQSNSEENLLNILLQRHMPQIRQNVRSLVCNKEDVEDLCQDIYCRILIKLRQGYYSNGHIQAWIYRIVQNYVYSFYRKKKHEFITQELTDLNIGDTWFDTVKEEKEKERILEAVLISFDKFVKHDLDECNLYHSFCGFSKEFIIDGQPSEVFQP